MKDSKKMYEKAGHGPYANLIDMMLKTLPPFPSIDLLQQVQACLSVPFPRVGTPVVREWAPCGERDGVRIRSLEWQLPYGPPTRALLLHPAEGKGPWPGVIVCHDHGGSRWFGHERVSDGVQGPPPLLEKLGALRPSYEGRAVANDLAAAGFCVLVHDVFTWGSRKFRPSDLGEAAFLGGPLLSDDEADPTPSQVHAYNAAANYRENTIAKWCEVSGCCFSGILAYEDRIAGDVLQLQAECRPGGVAVFGHSGGAARAACLAATDARIKAAICSCLVSTWPDIARHRSWLHTWQLWLPGLAGKADWSDVIACRAPMPLWVHYGLLDDGFTPEGQKAAHARIAQHYASHGAEQKYIGHLNPLAPHRFPVAEREAVCAWLREKVFA